MFDRAYELADKIEHQLRQVVARLDRLIKLLEQAKDLER